MVSHIRSAERFTGDATRKGLHYKSQELLDVITRLRLYHENRRLSSREDHRGRPLSEVLQYHLLIDLRDSLIKWHGKRRPEYDARHGAELAHEVMVELAELRKTPLKLVAGDILFRWVPKGLADSSRFWKTQRGALMTTISGAQYLQDFSHKRSGFEDTNLELSAILVEHVGIYADTGVVIEVGKNGIMPNPVAARDHYDLVVRSEMYGQKIADVARSAQCNYKYPFWDILTVSVVVHPGGAWLLDRDEILLHMTDREWKVSERNVPQQRVICSHFVNAVLYAATGGTLATATDHHFDEIFKVSPAQMWREFIKRQGVWRKVDAVFIGLQHKGNLDLDVDPRALGVGLLEEIVQI